MKNFFLIICATLLMGACAVKAVEPNWVKLLPEDAGITLYYDSNSIVEDTDKGIKIITHVINVEVEQKGAHSTVFQMHVNCKKRELEISPGKHYDGFYGLGNVVGESLGTDGQAIKIKDDENGRFLLDEFCK